MSARVPLLLASASPRRLELLRQAGIAPDLVVPAGIDEAPLPKELPAPYVRRIAMAKAKKAAAEHRDFLVLAADTVVAVGRRILPQAETEEQARACLELLSGRRHKVLTAVSVISPAGEQKTRVVTSVVRFKRLSPQEIAAYLATQEWQGKAGGYALQGQAATLVTFVSGSYSGIVGLPLHETVHMLRGLTT
ncbi:MAG: Maf family nucleotide pyrophosphatase [Pseudomonadota bacterium]